MMEQMPKLINITNETKYDYNKQWGYFKNTNVMYQQKGDKKYRLYNIFNFITQAVNVDVNLITKGIKVVGEDVGYIEILNAVYKDFRKDLFTMYLAVYGNAYLKIEIDEEKQLINLKVLQSPNVDFIKDADGNMLQVTYSYLQKDMKGNTTSIKEVYTSTIIQKYVDDKLTEEKENKYGFIPVYHFMFKDCGEKLGSNSFDEVTIQQDIVNAYANIVYQIGNKMLDPIYLVKGNFGNKDTAAIAAQFSKDIFAGINVLTTSPEGGVEIVSGGMENVDKALEFLDRVQANIEQNLPELLLTKLANHAVSGEALGRMLTQLQTKITGARENIQRGLRLLNEDIYEVLVSWGKIASTTENFTEIKFDEIFDYARAERLAEVRQELEMGVITTDIARQKLGIEWSGTEKETTSNGETSASSKTMDKTAEKKSFVRKIVDKAKSIFGADK